MSTLQYLNFPYKSPVSIHSVSDRFEQDDGMICFLSLSGLWSSGLLTGCAMAMVTQMCPAENCIGMASAEPSLADGAPAGKGSGFSE